MVLPVPFMTAAYLCVATNGVVVSMVAKKFAMKVWRADKAADLFVHIRAASVALGSERELYTKKDNKKRRRTKIERYIKPKKEQELDM